MVTRSPKATVISWAIYSGESLSNILDTYIDFHRFLLPFRSRLFVADFMETTTNIQDVLNRFAKQFDVALTTAHLGKDFGTQQLHEIAATWKNTDGTPNELQSPRPSQVRAQMTVKYENEFLASPHLQKNLQIAEELHRSFVSSQRANGAAKATAAPQHTVSDPCITCAR